VSIRTLIDRPPAHSFGSRTLSRKQQPHRNIEIDTPSPQLESSSPPQTRIAIGLIAAAGLPSELAEGLAGDLEQHLRERYPEGQWHVPLVIDGLVTPPAPATELIDATHRRLLREDWELAICLTDLPLRIGRHSVAGHASPTHRIALISVPALGPARLRRRVLGTALDLVDIILGEVTGDDDVPRHSRRFRQRLVDLSELADEDPAHGPTGLAALASGGRLRLLGGMVRANRPWRLAARLYRALIAAMATVAFALVTADIWRISASLDPIRLAAVTLLSIALTTVSLIAVHDLWERSRFELARDQVLLFNAATAITVTIGVASLYLALFVVSLAGAGLLITPDALSRAVGEDVGLVDYLRLAWLVGSLATVGGALGAGLESDVAIREAAYARRPESPLPSDEDAA
jgi:hypothetical protein